LPGPPPILVDDMEFDVTMPPWPDDASALLGLRGSPDDGAPSMLYDTILLSRRGRLDEIGLGGYAKSVALGDTAAKFEVTG
jgi:hypothetical protein